MSTKPPLRFLLKPPTASKSCKFSTTKTVFRASTKPRNIAARTIPPSKSVSRSSPPHIGRSQWARNSPPHSSSRYLIWSANMILSLCAFVWIRDHYVEIQSVSGSSMAPTLNPNTDETGRVDWVFMRPYMERSSREEDAEKFNRYGVKRGDVVMFWKPHKPEEIGIKRVVAIQGDTVYPTRGYALESSTGEARVQGPPDGLVDHDVDAVSESGVGKVVVPYGHVWVEGDNWRKSWDSNDFGPISKGLFLGKAVWMWRNWMRLEEVGDGRIDVERKMRSRVVEGQAEVPAIFLE